MMELIAILAALFATPVHAGEPSRFRDCADCPELLVIAPGAFVLGSDSERAAFGPAVSVDIPEPFAISVTETTFDQYQACIDAGACDGAGSDHGWGRGRRPVINVSWDDANAYAAWLSAATGHRYRLPSEAEWEFAARAGTQTRYPWGDAVGRGRANCRTCGSPPWGGDRTAPVASFPPEPSGLFDMLGNVSEWVADCWVPTHANHTGTNAAVEEGSNADCAKRVVKGGDWYYVAALATPAARQGNAATVASYTIGFRVLREIAP
ncbi:MAG: SUMF1/EgtB/PvdO family nonheme iron enzyme [Rhodobacteraceae bacterium]|nr:SUMF1/EgtB/PvdO family nonheme iron enzyme [Paracoccaceae bacterium]